MYRKSLLISLFLITLIFTGSLAVSAQTFIARGRVELRDANGAPAPLAGATVDTYRTDINSKGPSATTNKRGEYNIAGLQAGGLYMLVASGPGAAPKVINNVRSSRNEEYIFTLERGDGRRLTQDEAMQMAKGGNGPGDSGSKEPTAEQKKAQEEYAKQKAKYDAEKTKVEAGNKVIERTFKDGNAALVAKDYDLAITNYDEGINADPVFLGSAPSLLNNKSLALQLRGGDRYNKAVADKDDTLKAKAKEDMNASYDTAKKAYDMVTSKEALAETEFATSLPRGKYDALTHMAEALRLMTTSKLDTSRAEDITRVYRELMTVETLPEKKAAQQLTMADLLRVTGDCEAANVEYQKILAGAPENADALAGSGLCLINIGFITDNKEKLQEGLNTLQHFVDVAPDTHKLKADAKNSIEYLKNEQKLTPQKTPKTTPRKKP